MTAEHSLFVDTSAFIALRVQDDLHYRRAQGFLHEIKQKRIRLHTTNFILDEVYTYFCKYHEIAVAMMELISENPLILLNRVTAEDEIKARAILRTFQDKDFSYTDATSFTVMERLGIHAVFAFDDHFIQYGKFLVLPSL